MLVTAVGKLQGVTTEAVEVITLFYSVDITCLVQTFKKTTIQKWYFGKKIDDFLFAD